MGVQELAYGSRRGVDGRLKPQRRRVGAAGAAIFGVSWGDSNGPALAPPPQVASEREASREKIESCFIIVSSYG